MGSALTKTTSMAPAERKAALALAGLYALRMLGLFLVLPVFALYAENLDGATPFLVGIAIGTYGLTQACFQIPFGMLSDRVGRKRIIILGLVIFAVGSVVAAQADSIVGIIVGRAIQGAGAIAAAVLALAADLSREEQRTKVMAIIGVSIGFAFALSIILGPVLNSWVGVHGIFWITACLALAGIAVIHFVVPQPVSSRFHRDTSPVPVLFKRVLRDVQLLRLDFGVFILHSLLTATFLAIPLALDHVAGFPVTSHWRIYLPALVFSLLAIVPIIILAEKRQQMKGLYLAAVLGLCLVEVGFLGFYDSPLGVGILLFLFFTCFNFLEAALPSLITKLSPSDAKGTAMGVYSTSQFLGAFVGGALGGWAYSLFDLSGVFAVAALGALVWFRVAYGMDDPRNLSSYLLKVGDVSEAEAQQVAMRLSQVPGVAEAVVVAAEGVAYLKVDRHTLDKAALQSFSVV
jgi:MFS family permease